jgi:hypothetical protein
MWSGNKDAYERAEGDRGILIVACRRCRLLDCRPIDVAYPPNRSLFDERRMNEVWTRWITAEKRKRLGLSVYVS